MPDADQPREQRQNERVVLDMIFVLENSVRNVTGDNFFISFGQGEKRLAWDHL